MRFPENRERPMRKASRRRLACPPLTPHDTPASSKQCQARFRPAAGLAVLHGSAPARGETASEAGPAGGRPA